VLPESDDAEPAPAPLVRAGLYLSHDGLLFHGWFRNGRVSSLNKNCLLLFTYSVVMSRYGPLVGAERPQCSVYLHYSNSLAKLAGVEP
jgi:hypothetical protein